METKRNFEVYCSAECGEEFDTLLITHTDLQKFLETAKCPKCGAPIKRVYTFGAGQFRGSGFTKRGC